MKYLYRDRELYFAGKKYLLEWCDGPAYLMNTENLEKTFITMIDASNFTWIKNKTEFHLKIDRSTKRIAKEKVWKYTGFKKPGFEEVWECDCTISTKKIG